MLIRSLLPSDRSSVVEILDSNASGPQHSPFRPEEVACAVELLDAILTPSRADVEDYEGRVITDDQGRVVSYACFGITPMTDATYDLYWLATHADARGRGFGGALLRGVEEELRARGARNVRIETSQLDEQAALRFYLRLGYEIVGRIGDFYRPGDDLITLCKRLT